jgi:hypothetical protein
MVESCRLIDVNRFQRMLPGAGFGGVRACVPAPMRPERPVAPVVLYEARTDAMSLSYPYATPASRCDGLRRTGRYPPSITAFRVTMRAFRSLSTLP